MNDETTQKRSPCSCTKPRATKSWPEHITRAERKRRAMRGQLNLWGAGIPFSEVLGSEASQSPRRPAEIRAAVDVKATIETWVAGSTGLTLPRAV